MSNLDATIPNYYAVIPSTVRYDKALSPNAKLLYAEITALVNVYGYCFAKNDYFCELYDLSERQIQNNLKQLADRNYITIKIIDHTKRKIYLKPLPNEKNAKKEKSKNIKTFFEYDWLNDEN